MHCRCIAATATAVLSENMMNRSSLWHSVPAVLEQLKNYAAAGFLI
jgi:hypothetical protein